MKLSKTESNKIDLITKKGFDKLKKMYKLKKTKKLKRNTYLNEAKSHFLKNFQ